MVGYGEENKGYKLFDTSTCKTFIERSVKFEEEPIPYFELAPNVEKESFLWLGFKRPSMYWG